MDLMTVISDSERISKIPTVITDEVFTVRFFNSAAEELIPGLAAGHSFEEYVTIYDKCEIKRSKYPSSALLGINGKKYFCAFCPVISGFFKECVFSVAVPDGDEYDDCEQYLTMKLAVLSKCLFGSGTEGAPAGKERAYGKLYSAYEANMRLLTVMGGDESSAVNIKDLLEDAFSYYGTAKYGADSGKRYEINTDVDYIKLHKAVCIMLVCAYDICQVLSRNGFCSVSVNCRNDDGVTSYLYSVKPKHKLSVLLDSSDDAEDAVYCLLGRGAEDMFIIKTLARQVRGQADIEYDVLSDELRFSVTAPVDRSKYVKSGGRQMYDVARVAALAFISIRGKA